MEVQGYGEGVQLGKRENVAHSKGVRGRNCGEMKIVNRVRAEQGLASQIKDLVRKSL